MDRADLYPIVLAIAGALLFGASAPASKALLTDVDPVALAGLLYAGSGTGLALYSVLRRTTARPAEARLDRADLPWLAGSVVAGGVAAPVLLMVGLRSAPAATASLLLNFECVATAAIATVVFREAIGRRVWAAVALITLASALLTLDFAGGFGLSPGALGVIGACVFWGIDNNLTCNIASKDPVVIGMIKGLGAGAFSLAMAALLGRPLPGAGLVLAAMGLGAVSYGLSVVLFIRATRGMGAARASAWFGTAPFAGAALSLLVYRSVPGAQFIASLPFMIAGGLLLFGEEHDHTHVHAAVQHEHHYVPDVHHPLKKEGPGPHAHEEVRHSHPHRPDIHHRHGHDDECGHPDDRDR